MKRLFSFLILILVVFGAASAQAQLVVSGSANVFSNSQVTAAFPITANVQTGAHSLSISHGGLLTTTNFTTLGQIGIVDAVTGLTNWTYVPQNWTAANTNSTVETWNVTNVTFAAQGRLVLLTTNAWNLPNSSGAATYVTNTIILNY